MSEAFTGFEKVESNLKIHPEFRRSFQAAGKQDCCLSRHVTLTIDESIDALNGHTHPAGQFDLTDLHRKEELPKENFSRVGGSAMLWDHGDLVQW